MALSTNSGSVWKIAAVAPFLAILVIAGGCGNVKSSSPTPQGITITLNPMSAAVSVGTTKQFTAVVGNTSNTAVTWQVNGVAGGDSTHGVIDTTGKFTAPAAMPTPAGVTVTAVAQADSAKTVSAQVTITDATGAVSVTVSVPTVSVQTSHMQGISATVQNDSQSKGVTWTLTGSGCTGAACGTLSATSSASGTPITYTAPGAVPSPATVTVKATSVADTTKTATTTITITATATGSVAVSIVPKRAGLTTGQPQTFVPTVTGSSTTTVTWEVDTIPGGNSSVGTINASGLYTPPSSPGAHTVGARSVADSTVAGTASVAVTDLDGVFTYHNDKARDGANTKEYALNTSNVKSATFGKRFACTIDAAAYAQPLWVANVAIGGGTHNIVIAATQHDTVYAFDADASPCHAYWSKSLLGSGETWVSSVDVGTADLAPDIGIVGTPVIDGATKTLYVVSKSKNGTTFHQRLHALSLIDGSEKFAGPKDIAFSSGGVTFDPLRQNERCGLALVNGVVYIAYASHGDHPVYYGWVVGYNATTLAQTAVFNDAIGAGFSGIWMSGGAPSADSSNNLFVITGNGLYNGTSQFGDSFLKLSSGSSIGVVSSFTPDDEMTLNGNDTDLGSGGAAVLVDEPSSPVPHLLIGGGKDGRIFLLNRDNLGGKTSTNSGAVQILQVNSTYKIFSTPAFWQNTVYLAPSHGPLQAFALNTTTGQLAATTESAQTFNHPGPTASISSQGSANGIVWVIEQVNGGSAVLHAYDATNLATELWNSGGTAGQSVKFTVPTVANGKVYVGTAGEISVYGLSPN
jgi:hypothetical protein